MLKRLTITMQNDAEVFRDFETLEELNIYLEEIKAGGNWGKWEYQEQVSPAVYEDGEIVEEAVYETIPAEFSYEITDVRNPIAPISPRQLRLALLSQGITEQYVDTAIASMSSPDKEMAMIAWKYSTYYNREIPVVTAIGAMLNLDEDQMDQLWIYGATL